MREILELCPTPTEEECCQIGSDFYEDVSFSECIAFKNQLKRQFASPPSDARLFVKYSPHDFGEICEVAVSYSDDVGAEYAFNIEGCLPERWDSAAKEEIIMNTAHLINRIELNEFNKFIDMSVKLTEDFDNHTDAKQYIEEIENETRIEILWRCYEYLRDKRSKR